MEAAFVNIDLKLPRGASLGLYARRNALPTHTNYDIMEVVKGNEDKTRTSRAIKVSKSYIKAQAGGASEAGQVSQPLQA